MIGFLLIDKPAGITSHDVVDHIRALIQSPTSNLQFPKVGHTGTLDPFATGLLIVGVGREATREMSKLVGLDKTYEAEFVLGASSDTDDVTGRIEEDKGRQWRTREDRGLTNEEIETALKQFVGEIEQVPPAYSAIKIGGKKMYKEARAGKPMEAEPRRVTIYSIVIARRPPPALRADRLGGQADEAISAEIASAIRQAHGLAMTGGLATVGLTIRCSSGTYIRAIARDLGRELGTGGYVKTLRRTAIGPFSINESITLKALTSDNTHTHLHPISGLLARL